MEISTPITSVEVHRKLILKFLTHSKTRSETSRVHAGIQVYPFHSVCSLNIYCGVVVRFADEWPKFQVCHICRFAPSMPIYMEVTTLKVRKCFYGTMFLLNIPLFFMFVGSFIALFQVVGVPVFTDCRLKCLATVVFPLDIFLNWFGFRTYRVCPIGISS